MRRILILVVILCSCFGVESCTNEKKTVVVKIRILEAETKSVTPAMVCITALMDTAVHIPPNGEKLKSVSNTDEFYEGIEFNDDKNRIGPVRKMNGIGDNHDRSFVYGMLPSLPYWDAPVAYQTSGDFSIQLAPGKYMIDIEHGNEFIPVKEQIKVPKGKKEITKTFHLKRWINLPELGWYSGDVHVHHPTNKPGFKKFLLEYGKAEDVHVVNVLEMGHHEGTDFKQEGFGEDFRMNDGNIWLVSGQESPRSTYGHIIGLNINQLVYDTATYDYYDLAFKKLHKQEGAIVGFAHFSWNGCDLPRGFSWYITTEEIDFIELLQFSKINTLDYYDYLNLGFRMTAAAGSDIPWGSTIGEVRTFVYSGNPFNADVWFKGLKKGNTFVSNGPALFLEADGNLPGTEIIQKKGAITKISVKAKSHPGIGNIERLAVYNNDGLIIEDLNPGKLSSVQVSINHQLEKSQWLSAVVYCDNGAVAHTTPVYYIIDGKPTWDAQKAPGVIKKQFELMRIIEDETEAQDVPDQGILDRIEKAKKFYNNILEATGNKTIN